VLSSECLCSHPLHQHGRGRGKCWALLCGCQRFSRSPVESVDAQEAHVIPEDELREAVRVGVLVFSGSLGTWRATP
jgi:hypothetical protein